MKEFIRAFFAKLVCDHDWDVAVSCPIQPVYPEIPLVVNEAGWGMKDAVVNIHVSSGHIVALACNKCGGVEWNHQDA